MRQESRGGSSFSHPTQVWLSCSCLPRHPAPFVPSSPLCLSAALRALPGSATPGPRLPPSSLAESSLTHCRCHCHSYTTTYSLTHSQPTLQVRAAGAQFQPSPFPVFPLPGGGTGCSIAALVSVSSSYFPCISPPCFGPASAATAATSSNIAAPRMPFGLSSADRQFIVGPHPSSLRL